MIFLIRKAMHYFKVTDKPLQLNKTVIFEIKSVYLFPTNSALNNFSSYLGGGGMTPLEHHHKEEKTEY